MSANFSYPLPSLSELRELGYSMQAVAEYPGYFAAAQKSDRLVLGGKKYSSHKAQTWLAQGKRCCRCPKHIGDPREAHFHHTHGRGMGGGKRDDRDGEVLCHGCHRAAKTERRERWAPQACSPKAGRPAGESGTQSALETNSRGLFLVKGGAA